MLGKVFFVGEETGYNAANSLDAKSIIHTSLPNNFPIWHSCMSGAELSINKPPSWVVNLESNMLNFPSRATFVLWETPPLLARIATCQPPVGPEISDGNKRTRCGGCVSVCLCVCVVAEL